MVIRVPNQNVYHSIHRNQICTNFCHHGSLLFHCPGHFCSGVCHSVIPVTNHLDGFSKIMINLFDGPNIVNALSTFPSTSSTMYFFPTSLSAFINTFYWLV